MINSLKVGILYTIFYFIFKQVLDFRKFFDSESMTPGGGTPPPAGTVNLQSPKLLKKKFTKSYTHVKTLYLYKFLLCKFTVP